LIYPLPTREVKKLFPKNLTLQTERLRLTPIGMQDLEHLWPHVADPQISRLMSWQAHQDKSETTSFIENLEQSHRDGRGITWSIFKDDRFCGIISLINILRQHRALTYQSAELAYWLGLEFRGQRIMSEAGRSVIMFAFREMVMHRLEVGHFTSNAESERVIKQWGFHYIGEKRHAFMKNDVWHDAKFYDLLLTDVES
jgi:ribosomal-protein-alanine N-acetyltransferase